MPIPIAGDPYYKPDGAIRRTYYGVNSVPQIFFNGTSALVVSFEEQFKVHFPKQMPIVEIRGNFNVVEETIKIDFNIVAYEDIDDAVVHVAVNEKHTTGNVGSNGEKDFYHVMMKMLPDGNGTPINLKRYGVQNFTFEYNLSSTNVEELDDLEVNVFVQNKNSKQIYNGNYLLDRTILENAPPSDLKLVVPGIKGMGFEAEWKAPANDKFTGYNLYVNDEKIASNITTNGGFFELPDGDPCKDINVVKVSVLYPDGVESVRIAEYEFECIGSVKQIDKSNVKIYPNPADNYITVNADQNMKTVEVYNMFGQLQNVISLNTSNHSINLEKYTAGVYFLRIMLEDGSSVNRKIVVK
jgi:hypothetical protein